MNFETKRASDRRCEFWLEFENGVKMFAEMIDPVKANQDLIPPLFDGHMRGSESQKKVLIQESDIVD